MMPAQIRLTFRQLETLVGPVLPFAGAADSGPRWFDALRLRTDDDIIIAEAVSQGSVAVCRRPLPGVGPGLDILLPAGDVRTLVSLKADVTLRATTDESVIADVHSSDDVRSSSWVFDTFPLKLWPDVDHQVRKSLEGPFGSMARMPHVTLERLAEALRPAFNTQQDPVMVHPPAGPHAPILVTCGGWFAAVTVRASTTPLRRSKWFHPEPISTDPITLWKSQLNPEGE